LGGGEIVMTKERPTARETYAAYLKGQITPAEVERRAQAWYAAEFGPAQRPPKDH
jgi:hypothetical protein